ncbi:hypothetical protein IT882_01365 [Microbacterium schleiferi]|uniref:Asl1-like glycosyl hydrolase catalytic domain-containing protein n=1 Tax=Microbacterium schleiferi TaxID=69362 RepID=A0A7S8MX56_9MICO|nr:hypothetical protein IT882_01365 [Microbacterium schleiferi]
MSHTDDSSPAVTAAADSSTRTFVVDVGDESSFRQLNGVGGIPGPVEGYPQFPDMTPLWREAGVTVVRSFDWVSRLDTRNNPTSLFPDWSADVDDPASYNFAATDQWVEAVQSIGAEVMFTVASSIPSNKLPAEDVEVYGRVVEHIVRHYSQGWAGGPTTPIRIYEFGDQPDFGPLHFAGRPEEFYAMYRAFCEAVHRVDPTLTVGGLPRPSPLSSTHRTGKASSSSCVRTTCRWTSSLSSGSPTAAATPSTTGTYPSSSARCSIATGSPIPT